MDPRRRRPVLDRLFGTVPGVRWLVGGIFTASVACAVLARLIAPQDFPSLELAFWWAVQTVTTVGYGDITPESREGQLVAAALMLAAIASLSLLTASISAAFVSRLQARRIERHEDPVLSALERIEQRLEQVERRLESS